MIDVSVCMFILSETRRERERTEKRWEKGRAAAGSKAKQVCGQTKFSYNYGVI
jgi:hypothetical protein